MKCKNCGHKRIVHTTERCWNNFDNSKNCDCKQFTPLEEFNLSNKTLQICVRCRGICNSKDHKMIELEDVKEFIKKLKEFYKEQGSKNELNAFLNKLAGKDLI